MEDCTTPPSPPSIRVNLLRAHGSSTRYLYNRGCRCVACRAAHAEYNRKYNAEHAEERNEYDRNYNAGHAEEKAEYNRNYKASHADEIAERDRKYRAEHPEEIAERRLQQRYGISTSERGELFSRQGGNCAICGTTKPCGSGYWHTDHDHETGQVRGILCHHCNAGLGFFRDDPERLMAASEYLARSCPAA